MKISMIYAEIRGVIAIDGKLPIHMPEDLKFFQSYTMGKVLVMGRKTVESLPKKLEGRTVVCLTREEGYINDKADIVLNSQEDVLEWATEQDLDELVVAGGKDVYELFMEDCHTIVKTRINHTKIPKKEFVKMKDKLESPDMSIKGEWNSAEVLFKTNEMVVVEYSYGDV